MTFRPNDMNKYMEALQQTHGRVFMASADWANGCAGFVDGAIEQGAKAAVEAMKALGVWRS
jgi:lysyl oxidase-like protein 2/3/4